MAIKRIVIDNVLGGVSQSQYFAGKGQYQAATGIDPDMPVDETTVRSSGFLRPTAMAKFSSTEITGVPLWMVTNPKDTNTYVYANDGKCHVVNSSLAMGTALNSGNALTTSDGNGAAYYDNYLYLARRADIARYGPLNGSPSLTQDYWTSTLSLTAPSNTTYPSVRGVALPNHVMHRHTDNKLYFTDVASNQGQVHFIKTSKSSAEGDTNDGSTYSALDLPYGYYPTALESYGSDLVVAMIEGVNTTIRQKNAKIAFWDTTSASYSIITDVEFPDPLITAVRNVNGILYVFSGNAQGGCRISRFAGGYTFQELYYDEDGLPPLQGAVDHLLNKVLWGNYTTDPESAAVVKALGSKRNGFMPINAMSVPFRASSSNTTNQWVTAVKYIEHSSFLKPQPIIGWTDGAGKGLDKATTTYTTSVFQSEVFRVGQPFQVVSVSIPFAQAIAANMTITPKLWYDDASDSDTLTVVNNTNYAGSQRRVLFEPTGSGGKNDFFLELTWSGSALLTVKLPIVILIDVLEDGTN